MSADERVPALPGGTHGGHQKNVLPQFSILKYIAQHGVILCLGGLVAVTSCLAATSFILLMSRDTCAILEAGHPPDPCDDGWIWYRRKCYYFSQDIGEWEKSRDFCAYWNATLAIIDFQYERDFILRFKGSPDHWIGLRRASDGSPWVWTNGSPFNNTFPIVGVSDCVLVNSGRISSASCYSDKHWICNKPEDRSLTPHF